MRIPLTYGAAALRDAGSGVGFGRGRTFAAITSLKPNFRASQTGNAASSTWFRALRAEGRAGGAAAAGVVRWTERPGAVRCGAVCEANGRPRTARPLEVHWGRALWVPRCGILSLPSLAL